MRARGSTWLLLSSLACTSEPTAETKPEPAVTEPVAAAEPTPVELKPEPTPAPEPPPVVEPPPTIEAPPEPPPAAPEPPPAVLAPTPMLSEATIVATPHSPPWTPGGSVPADMRLEYVTIGVLGVAAQAWYSLDESGAIVGDPKIVPPEGPVLGAWPKDAWVTRVEDFRTGYTVELLRWRNNGKWVAQAIGDSTRQGYDVVPLMTKGWRGGFLITHYPDERAPQQLVRVAGGADDPPLPHVEDQLALFESNGGRIYVFSHPDNSKDWIVQRSCAGEAEQATCEASTKRLLPCPDDGRYCDWELFRSAPRQRYSMSMIFIRALAAAGDTPSSEDAFLVSYEEGGWKVERSGDDFDRLWPSKDGGLWIADAKRGLWHRDPKGSWRSIELPAGYDPGPGGAVQLAIDPDQQTVYLVGAVNGEWQWFTTHADAQNPPPATPPPATSG